MKRSLICILVLWGLLFAGCMRRGQDHLLTTENTVNPAHDSQLSADNSTEPSIDAPDITQKITLEEISSLSQEARDLLFVGMTKETVHADYGEPNDHAYGFAGDIYHIPNRYESVIFRYDTNAIVEKVQIEYHNGVHEVPGGARFIVDIIDRTLTEDIACDTAFEKFHEDDSNAYYFGEVKSQYVMVVYNNGISENVVAALTAGRARMQDLDTFGLHYIVRPKYQVKSVNDNGLILEPLQEKYIVGETVLVKAATVTENNITLLVNGKETDPFTADLAFTWFQFVMPAEDVLIEIVHESVDIPSSH